MRAISKAFLVLAGVFLLASYPTQADEKDKENPAKDAKKDEKEKFNPFNNAKTQAFLQQQAAINNAILGRAAKTQPARFNPYGGGRLINRSSPVVPVDPIFDPYRQNSGSYGGYASFVNPFPYEGYLRGVSSVIDAQTKYAIGSRRARLLNLEAERSKIDLRRQIFDQWLYERANTPTFEDRRQERWEQEVIHARRNPDLGEILSGRSLNTLLKHTINLLEQGKKGATIPLQSDVIAKVNVSSGAGGNIGLLKDEGKLNWPLTLREDIFNEMRESFGQSVGEAVAQAKQTGRVDTSILKKMIADLKSMRQLLDKSIGDLSPSQYIQGLRYLNQLDSGIKALQDPEVAKYFSKKYAPTGEDVAELVDYMRKNGLSFAPAVQGDTAAYKALHSSLVSFANSLDNNGQAQK